MACGGVSASRRSADTRAVGRPAESTVENSGRRVTGGFISRSTVRTISGRLRGPHSPSSGLAVSGHSSTGEQKPVRRRRAVQQLNEADVLPLANLESRSDWSILKQVEIRPNARGLSLPLGGAGLQRFYFGEISPRASSESPYEQSVVHIARSGWSEARRRGSCSSRHVGMRKPRFERQAWSPPWAAQPAHAADRLPRRVRSSLALVSRFLAEEACLPSYPASGVAVRLSLLACCVAGRNTPAADARRWAARVFSDSILGRYHGASGPRANANSRW